MRHERGPGVFTSQIKCLQPVLYRGRDIGGVLQPRSILGIVGDRERIELERLQRQRGGRSLDGQGKRGLGVRAGWLAGQWGARRQREAALMLLVESETQMPRRCVRRQPSGNAVPGMLVAK